MFKERLLSGIVLLVIAIGVLALGSYPLAVVLCFISVVGYLELTKVLSITPVPGQDPAINLAKQKKTVLEIMGIILIPCYYILLVASQVFHLNPVYQMMGIICVILAFLFAYVFDFSHITADQVVAAAFSFIYAPVMLSFVYSTRMMYNGQYLVWLILIGSWGCDTCAYCVGKLIGKKKIFPVLSPKKSLEGCIGGVVGTALIGFLYGFFYVEKWTGMMNHNVAFACAFVCAVCGLMSMVGDLAASAIKRNKMIKDYGKLIPGHGGIMDRFDSMIVIAPVLYVLLLMLW